MRRGAIAVVVSVVGGYAFGGIGYQPVVRAATLTASARLAAQVRERVTASGVKTLEYGGYELSVPASWPVYRLAENPTQCVRYDVHAIYLGTPGPDQECPAGLVGRTETVSIGDRIPGARPAIIGQRVALGGRPDVILQDAAQRELGVTLPPSGPVITATYGSDPGLVERVLASIHEVVPQSARPVTVPAADGTAADGTAPDGTAPDGTAPDDTAEQPLPIQPSPEDAGLPSAAAPQTQPKRLAPRPRVSETARPRVSATEPPAARTAPGSDPASTAALATAVPSMASLATEPMPGFDTCTAPSLPAMRAWRAKFAATAIYIGGEEMACDYGNLSAEWIKAAEAMGWSLLPTYVGPQASCNTFSGEITPKHAAAEGRAAAADAIADAEMFGLGKGAPLYYDMEAYNGDDARCVAGVLTFLDAWTRQLNADGYMSGVYSSADSGVIDLDTVSSVDRHSLAEPQSLWFALWDDSNNLNGEPYLTEPLWPSAHLSKQYAGSHWVKIHKFALDVDLDLIDSAVVR